MAELIELMYQDDSNGVALPIIIDFTSENEGVFINVTRMGRSFGKPPSEFLVNKQTRVFVDALEDKTGIPALRIVKGGRGKERQSGTWMHRLLALRYCGWLSPRFELWMSEQIDTLLRQGKVELPARRGGRVQTATVFAVPQSFAEALELAATQQRELEQLRVNVDEQNGLINEQSDRLVRGQVQLMEARTVEVALNQQIVHQTIAITGLEKKALHTDQYLAVGKALSMEEAAKSFGYGRNTFMQMLRARGILGQQSRLPASELIKRGYFRVKPVMSNGCQYVATYVTPHGMKYLSQALNE